MVILYIINLHVVNVKKKEDRMNTKETISNLELMSSVLEKEANKPNVYNTDWGYYLEQISWSLYKQANELRDIEHILGQ